MLATIALAVLVASEPVSRGAGIAPPELVLTFTDPRSSLEEVRFGDQRVLMARGRHSIMAAVVSGKRLNGLPVRLQRAVAGFEETHMDALSRWNGNLETLDSADVAFRSVLAPRDRGFTPT